MRNVWYEKERYLCVMSHAICPSIMLCQENGRTSEDYVYESYLIKEKEEDHEV